MRLSLEAIRSALVLAPALMLAGYGGAAAPQATRTVPVDKLAPTEAAAGTAEERPTTSTPDCSAAPSDRVAAADGATVLEVEDWLASDNAHGGAHVFGMHTPA